jgi:hypothetical protein
MELNVAIRQEVHFSCVSAIFANAAHYGVLFVCNRAQIKKRFVKLAQSRQVVGTDVHVMELEIHRNCPSFGLRWNPLTHAYGVTVFCEARSIP